MSTRKIGVVTGANRGIGLAICEEILQRYGPVKLYACSRAGKDLGLTSDNTSEVIYPKLDITQIAQIRDLASTIKSTDGHVDVLINNAGLNKADGKNLKNAEEIMTINYYGTLAMCQSFLPLMSDHGRLVNVSSTASSLQYYSPEVQEKFRDSELGLSGIEAMAKGYLEDLKAGHLEKWGDVPAYCVSKACMNAMTATLAKQNHGLYINCCCPGWVDTDMGRIVGQPPKIPTEGAKIPVRLGFGNIEEVSGKYWANPGVFDTGDGQVMPW